MANWAIDVKDGAMLKAVRRAGAAMLLAFPWWASAVTIEGVELPETVVVAGQKLVLNGAGSRKRGYFKASVEAIYVPERRSTLEGIYKQPGAKRILLFALKDIPGATISRYFVSDFKAVATDAEFKSLINEVAQIGAVYGSVHKVNKGDMAAIDWIPGKGLTTLINGKQVEVEGYPTPYMNSELMFQILLRIYAGPAVADELRQNMLGLSKSMWTSSAADH